VKSLLNVTPFGTLQKTAELAMDLSEVIERISEKIMSKGKSVDRNKIETKLKRLIEEFGVHISEAERTVLNELAREYSIDTLSSRAAEQKEIGLLIPGEWVTIEGKVVALLTPPTPAMAQTGIIADPTGAIRYVVWSKANAPQLEEGKWYHIESAVVDEFRGAPKLNIHSGTTITPVELDTPIMPTMSKISDLRPGVGSLRAKVIQDWEPSHPRMLQTGLLGDESGTIRFTIWNDGNKEKLTLNTVYSIYYAQIDEFNGRLQLNLTGSICMPEEGNIEP
jgi:replication factor A1